MDDETIKRILPILASADGGCSHCGPDLIAQFGVEFGVPCKRMVALFNECKVDVYWSGEAEGNISQYYEYANEARETA